MLARFPQEPDLESWPRAETRVDVGMLINIYENEQKAPELAKKLGKGIRIFYTEAMSHAQATKDRMR